MKCNHIILAIASVLSCLLCSCHTEEKPTDSQIADFVNNRHAWIHRYIQEKAALPHIRAATELRKQTSTTWDVYKDSVRNIVLKKEIVYIKRMASSSVMNSPAFYEKYYFGNTVTENGRGAENEDITVFYLSDGNIIKASPKVNPEWLGTTVGEKALKITGKRLTAELATEECTIPSSNEPYAAYMFWHERQVTTAAGYKYVDYVIYQPLYSN